MATHTRVGDLAWRARYHTHHELSLGIRLWFDQGDLVAWTWLRTREAAGRAAVDRAAGRVR